MNITHVFSTNVKRYRLMRGFSQEELAERSGLHRTYISAIECERRNISIENIQRIAEALDVEPHTLLEAKDGIQD